MIILKTKEQIDIMDDANKIVHDILFCAKDSAKAGMSTYELDKLMEDKLNQYDVESAFKGYFGYPNISCISVNEVIVHGIPSKDTILKDSDLISIDLGVHYKGFVGDSAISFFIGNANKEHENLSEDTRKALYAGIDKMRIGNRLNDISKAINDVAKKNNYGVVRDFSGHGVGSKMHESPSVYNYIEPREPNIRLQEGLVLALEPMFVLGSPEFLISYDRWTVYTKDNSIAAHWELSVAVTKDGPRILGNDES